MNTSQLLTNIVKEQGVTDIILDYTGQMERLGKSQGFLNDIKKTRFLEVTIKYIDDRSFFIRITGNVIICKSYNLYTRELEDEIENDNQILYGNYIRSVVNVEDITDNIDSIFLRNDTPNYQVDIETDSDTDMESDFMESDSDEVSDGD